MYGDIVQKLKIQMKDLDWSSDLNCYDMVQPKYDGWWTYVDINSEMDVQGFRTATIVTSGGEQRSGFKMKCDVPAILLCEWIYGTNWSQQLLQKGNNLFDKFVIFDAVMIGNKDLSNVPYKERLIMMNEWRKSNNFINKFMVVPSYMVDWGNGMPMFNPYESIQELAERKWKEYVEESNFEGLVFKKSTDPLPLITVGRLKKVVTMDYIVIGFKEGTKRLEGTLGAIEGGLLVDGKVQRICTVGGGFTDELRDEIWCNKETYIGRVFEARGKVLFSSGALRHPAFTKWRDDKKPEQCVFGE